MRTVNRGDEYYLTTHEIPDQDGKRPPTWTVQLMHRNKGWRQTVWVRDGGFEGPYQDHAIWARTGYPDQESAQAAGLSQGIMLGLGNRVSVGDPEKDDEPAESSRR